MFSQEDSHASRSRSLVEERERTITATSGRTCFGRFGKFSPLGSLVRTLLESRRWWSPAKSLSWGVQTIYSRRITYTERKASSHSTKSAKTLKKLDIPSNRLLFQLVPSEHRTEETGFGLLPTVQTQGLKQCNKQGKTEFMPLDLLPTPNAMDIPHKDMEINERGRRNPKKGKTDHSLGLEDMAVASLLPTPTAIDRGGGRTNKSLSPNAAERPTLALAARKGLLPTPTVAQARHKKRIEALKEKGAESMCSRKNGSLRPNGLMDYLDFQNLLPTPCSIEATKYTKTYNPKSQMGQSLTALACSGLMPTPNARDWKGCTNPGVKKANGNTYGETLPDTIKRMSGGTSPQLNPLFVEEMMGFPLMWTALPFLSPSGDRNP